MGCGPSKPSAEGGADDQLASGSGSNGKAVQNPAFRSCEDGGGDQADFGTTGGSTAPGHPLSLIFSNHPSALDRRECAALNATIQAKYNRLGQLTLSQQALVAEMGGIKRAGGGVKGAMLQGWGNQERYDECTKELEVVTESILRTQDEVAVQKVANGKRVAPAVKASSSAYQAAFVESAGTPEGGAAVSRLVNLLKGVPDGREKGAPKPEQPATMTLPTLQESGVKEAVAVFDLLAPVCDAGSNVCKFEKLADRAAEKAEKYGKGGILKVTDFGRMTVVAADMMKLEAAVSEGKAILEAEGYEFILQKNTLDMAVDTTAAGGFRNLHTLVRNIETKIVIEVQWTLATLEEIKHSPIGHVAYEVMRKSGLTSNTTCRGNINESMVDAIECGQVLDLVLNGTSWTAEGVEMLAKALAAPGCRVKHITLGKATGDETVRHAACVTAASTPTVRFLSLSDTQSWGALGKVLQINTTLQSLWLSHCNMSDSDGGVFVKVVLSMASLRRLWLWDCNLSGTAGGALGASILTNTSLEELGLKYSTGLGPVGGGHHKGVVNQQITSDAQH